MIRGQRRILRAAEGSSMVSRSVLISSGLAPLCKVMYCSLCMYVWLLIDSSPTIPTGEPHRDEEIDVEERDGEGGKTETMYVCMYEWMDVHR